MMGKKKSDLSKCSVESEDSDSDLKIVGNVGTGYESDNVYRTDGISPTLKAQTGGKTKGSQLIIDASGQMTTINMPVKSIEEDSEQENLSKETSETSQPIKYLNMNFLQEDFPVKLFPLLENAKVFKTKQKELFSTKFAVLLEVKDQASYCLKTLKDYFLTTTDGPLQLYCFHWMNLGMMLNGRCLTLNIGYHKTGKGSLSSVLEEKVDEKYYLKLEYLKKMADYNLRQKIAGRGFRFEPKNVIMNTLKEGGEGMHNVISDALQATGGQEGGTAIKEAWCIPEATLRGKKLPFMGGPLQPKKEMTHPLSASARYFVTLKEKESPADWIKKLKKAESRTNRMTHRTLIHNVYGGFGEGKRIFDKHSPTIRTSKGGGHLPSVVETKAVLTPDRKKRRQEGRPVKENEEPMFTLTGQDVHGIQQSQRIRRLTPIECERLQGFPDDWTAGVSDSQRYKMMGNAVSVPVIQAIGRKILNRVA